MFPDDETAVAARLWEEHKAAAFPAGLRGQDVAGVDTIMLDAEVAGCIAAWIGNAGTLDSSRREILAQSLVELDRILPLLADAEERRYFQRLRDLAAVALGGT
jgi:hypothetical protein